MRVGVVCEGWTDFHAIKAFFGGALAAQGIQAAFEALAPSQDSTWPDAGWGNVLRWLLENPSQRRVAEYFNVGLFDNSPRFDGLLIQMDADILGEIGFCAYVQGAFGHTAANPQNPAERAAAIATVLRLVAGNGNMTNADARRHVIAPAVESTETWCVAAFKAQPVAFERLRDQALTDAFMIALETSESRTPTPPYAHIDKQVERRKRFCERYSEQGSRVARCPAFAAALSELSRLMP